MPSLDLLLAFVIATSIFAFMPGPAMIYVAAQTIARGRRAGWMATLGVSLGGFVHVIAAAVGLSAIFTYVPLAYTALKIAGVAYLIWLGISIIRSRIEAVDVASIAPKSARRAFIDSMVVEILNPKTAIFFIAFLPQFVDPAAAFPIWLQLLILGTVVNIFFAMGDVVAVLGSSVIVSRVSESAAAQRVARWIGGGLLIGLGVKLATDKT
jgi:threonine/homoserine/homoserine lactone efflux protein